MSRGLICDQCGTVLPLNARGEHDGGEDSAWIQVTIANQKFDLCSRACTHELLDREDVIEAHNGYLEVITDIARVITEGRETDDDEEPSA